MMLTDGKYRYIKDNIKKELMVIELNDENEIIASISFTKMDTYTIVKIQNFDNQDFLLDERFDIHRDSMAYNILSSIIIKDMELAFQNINICFKNDCISFIIKENCNFVTIPNMVLGIDDSDCLCERFDEIKTRKIGNIKSFNYTFF